MFKKTTSANEYTRNARINSTTNYGNKTQNYMYYNYWYFETLTIYFCIILFYIIFNKYYLLIFLILLFLLNKNFIILLFKSNLFWFTNLFFVFFK